MLKNNVLEDFAAHTYEKHWSIKAVGLSPFLKMGLTLAGNQFDGSTSVTMRTKLLILE